MDERYCEVCGKKLRLRNKKYCSAACRTQAQEERKAQKLEKEIRVCKFCGEKFVPDRQHTKYCSEECRKNFYSTTEKKKLPEKECPICHEMFEPRTYNQVYCSKKCRQRTWTFVGMYQEKYRPEQENKTQTELRSAVAKLEVYNRKHKMNLSYGEAVARRII